MRRNPRRPASRVRSAYPWTTLVIAASDHPVSCWRRQTSYSGAIGIHTTDSSDDVADGPVAGHGGAGALQPRSNGRATELQRRGSSLRSVSIPYRLTALATDAAGNASTPARIRFRARVAR